MGNKSRYTWRKTKTYTPEHHKIVKKSLYTLAADNGLVIQREVGEGNHKRPIYVIR